MSWTVIGRGPAGLLAASLLNMHGEECRLVAAHEGTMALWSGVMDRGDPELLPLNAEEWQTLWTLLSRLWGSMGIETRLGPALTLSCTGSLKATFLCPTWQYCTPDPGPLWIVAFEGLPDSLQDIHLSAIEAATGHSPFWQRLPRPPGWDDSWTAVRWASFIDQTEGKFWLKTLLQDLNPRVPAGWPLLLPQVIGRIRTGEILREIGRDLRRPVFEYPLVMPSLGGMRIRDLWQAWLRNRGVPLISGSVTEYLKHRIHLDDGRSWGADHVLMATGGILGGGIKVLPNGVVEEAITHRALGQITAETGWGPVFRWGSEANGSLSACGRQRSGWDPDRDRNGGAMILATVYQALREQGLNILTVPRKGGLMSHAGF
ncbi:MAG: hypothetical protein M1294_16635 [Firmicutes bacterium]|uniref:Uncharacterized protein n=1 Tax=Sulfobacillus benefaciens TaxID=453960 RepID=A0A2T2X4E2_9FIRM|nr:hypothetical protein [Bacillota bacterium]MCL5013964.1 hypothetical protein [Bacillota bacterium]PSR29326.1 MAG: hypothetical protein C7B43_08245 [Sulfobacillus benefaciens]